MGIDKRGLLIDGVPMVRRVALALASATSELMVVTHPHRPLAVDWLRGLPMRTVHDHQPVGGPLAGLAAALAAARKDWVLVVAADMPWLAPTVLDMLAGRALESDADAVVLVAKDGRVQPLLAAYRRRVRRVAEQRLERGLWRLTDLLDEVAVELVPFADWSAADPSGRSTMNINRSADLGDGGHALSALRPESRRHMSLTAAREMALSMVEPLGSDRASLAAAGGRRLTADLRAPSPLPQFDNAAMDGWAVRAASVRHDQFALAEVVPIWTGQPLPESCDAVVPMEHGRVGAGVLRIDGPIRLGQHVRRVGEELEAGDVALMAGDRIGPAAVGLLTALGIEHLEVRARPRVAILVTGDEVIHPEAQPVIGEVRNSNGPMLHALIEAAGGEVGDARQLPDDPERIAGAIVELAMSADLVCTSGGASVGSRDHVISAAGVAGVVACHGLAIRPGRPTSVALVGDTPVVILPGNPFALLVGYQAIALPLIRRLAGDPRPLGFGLPARISEPVASRPGIDEFLPVRLETRGAELTAVPLARRGAAMLLGAARAHGLALLDAATTDLPAGAIVTVELLDQVG